MDVSRRAVFSLVSGFGSSVLAGLKGPVQASVSAVPTTTCVTPFGWAKMELFRRGVIAEVGEDKFDAWFRSVEMESLESGKLIVSVPVPFLKRWIDEHYDRPLLRGAQRAEPSVQRVEVILRKPRNVRPAPKRMPV
jgi:hypothetical protein